MIKNFIKKVVQHALEENNSKFPSCPYNYINILVEDLQEGDFILARNNTIVRIYDISEFDKDEMLVFSEDKKGDVTMGAIRKTGIVRKIIE